MVNICCLEYEFTTTANFTTKNNCIKSYHYQHYPEGYYSADYFKYYFRHCLDDLPKKFKQKIIDKEFDLVLTARNKDADDLRKDLNDSQRKIENVFFDHHL